MALKFSNHPCRSFAEFMEFEKKHDLLRQSLLWEVEFAQPYKAKKEPFSFKGYCTVCQKDTTFALIDWKYTSDASVKYPDMPPNSLVPCWREHLSCQSCGLSSRFRSTISFVKQNLPRNAVVHIAELTGLFHTLSRSYPLMIGSEYFKDGTAKGHYNAQLMRFEDITDLSFPDSSLDATLHFDVLEHVPNYQDALKEFYRVLKPKGKVIMTAPFFPSLEHTTIFATVDAAGAITHLREPEYHESHTGPVLCYQYFGWDLLTAFREAGFRDAAAYLSWDPSQGYMGIQDCGPDAVLVAVK